MKRGNVRRAAATTWLDLIRALRHLWINVIGGSFLLPRVARFLVYRSARLDVMTPNVADGCRIRGSGQLSIGPDTYVGRECYFEAVGTISIGRDCHLAMQVMIVTTTHDLDVDGSVARMPAVGSVTIGNGAWLGARATVLPGVTIGDGVVVAAGSVVSSDCLSRGLYGGVPARWVRDLPVDATVPEAGFEPARPKDTET